MATNELETFLKTWNREAEGTLKLLRALPATQYDFRPDAGGRSLGELAWHLAEGDAYMSQWVATGTFDMVRIYRPQGSDRLSDFARSPEQFLYLETPDATYLVNARHLIELVEETL